MSRPGFTALPDGSSIWLTAQGWQASTPGGAQRIARPVATRAEAEAWLNAMRANQSRHAVARRKKEAQADAV